MSEFKIKIKATWKYMKKFPGLPDICSYYIEYNELKKGRSALRRKTCISFFCKNFLK